MIIVLDSTATEEQVRVLEEKVRTLGLESVRSSGKGGEALLIRGDTRGKDLTSAFSDEPVADRLIEVLPKRVYEQLFSRRSFLDRILAGLGVVVTLILGSMGIAYVLKSGRKLHRAGILRVGAIKDFDRRPYQLVSHQGAPIIVVRSEKQRYYALASVCTHSEICQVQWDPKHQQFECPCHRAAFDVYGNVLHGPPPRPLRSYPVQVLENQVYVNTTS